MWWGCKADNFLASDNEHRESYTGNYKEENVSLEHWKALSYAVYNDTCLPH